MFCSTKQRTGGGGGYYAVNSWAAVTLLKNEVKLAVRLLKVSYFLNVDAHSQVRKHTRFTYITHALSSNSAWVESVTNTVQAPPELPGKASDERKDAATPGLVKLGGRRERGERESKRENVVLFINRLIFEASVSPWLEPVYFSSL